MEEKQRGLDPIRGYDKVFHTSQHKQEALETFGPDVEATRSPGTPSGCRVEGATWCQEGSHLRSHLAVSGVLNLAVLHHREQTCWEGNTSSHAKSKSFLFQGTTWEKVKPSAPECASCPTGSSTEKSSTWRMPSLQKIPLECEDTHWQQPAPLRYTFPPSNIYLRNFMHRKERVKGNIQIHDRNSLYCDCFFSQHFVFF